MLASVGLALALALSAVSDEVEEDELEDGAKHEQAEQTVIGLEPRFLLYGHLYDGLFKIVSSAWCDPGTGEMYVVDPGRNTVAIFDEHGSPLFAFTDPEHLDNPIRVGVDPKGRIHVLDADGGIRVFSFRGEFLGDLQLPDYPGRAEARFSAFTFDGEGNLYAGDSHAGQVLVFDPELKQLKARIGRKGDLKGQLTAIVGIAVDAERVYVADAESVAVQVFTHYGRFINGWGYHDVGTHNVSLPHGIAVDAKGRIVLIDTMRQEIKYFDPEGRMIDRFGGLGREPGAVNFPADVSIDRQGRLCVADKGNGRVQVLAPVEGTPAPQSGRQSVF